MCANSATQYFFAPYTAFTVCRRKLYENNLLSVFFTASLQATAGEVTKQKMPVKGQIFETEEVALPARVIASSPMGWILSEKLEKLGADYGIFNKRERIGALPFVGKFKSSQWLRTKCIIHWCLRAISDDAIHCVAVEGSTPFFNKKL